MTTVPTEPPAGLPPSAGDTRPATDPQPPEQTRAVRRQLRARRRRRMRVVVASVVTLVLAVTGFLVVKAAAKSGKVFGGGGGVAALVGGGVPLHTDSYGRVNLLIFGTSHDDPAHSQGVGGQGMWLTDSIQVLSVDPTTGAAAMIAVPRDTWVKLAGKCIVGADAKINAVYECATGHFDTPQDKIPDYAAVDANGAQALARAVTTVTGLDIGYWVHIDYTAVRQAVDAVGGIDVEIVGDGHEGIFDTNLDGDCPHEAVSCRHVYYPRDGVYHLTGQQALDLARARGDANPRSCMQFGLNGGDFNRQANQQRVLAALKGRVASAGTLANPAAVNSLIDALGDNVTTNFTTDEAKTAIDLARRLGELRPISLVDPTTPVLTDGTVAGQSIIRPVAGLFDYAAIHRYVRNHISPDETSSATTTSGSGKTSSSGKTTGKSGSSASSTSAASSAATSGEAAPTSSSTPTSTPTATHKSTYEPPASCWGG